eukprot:TRINITY_DN13847_c0_g1_i1.p1 TRINITY_DN13847_c0_g1~~TRINITY_DN13847_c0_g1_i1.p1  ORF type:complete len:524 (-),score=120.36 TRINITY_DN13847_c0_g1_i1:114-1499(-)
MAFAARAFRGAVEAVRTELFDLAGRLGRAPPTSDAALLNADGVVVWSNGGGTGAGEDMEAIGGVGGEACGPAADLFGILAQLQGDLQLVRADLGSQTSTGHALDHTLGAIRVEIGDVHMNLATMVDHWKEVQAQLSSHFMSSLERSQQALTKSIESRQSDDSNFATLLQEIKEVKTRGINFATVLDAMEEVRTSFDSSLSPLLCTMEQVKAGLETSESSSLRFERESSARSSELAAGLASVLQALQTSREETKLHVDQSRARLMAAVCDVKGDVDKVVSRALADISAKAATAASSGAAAESDADGAMRSTLREVIHKLDQAEANAARSSVGAADEELHREIRALRERVELCDVLRSGRETATKADIDMVLAELRGLQAGSVSATNRGRQSSRARPPSCGRPRSCGPHDASGTSRSAPCAESMPHPLVNQEEPSAASEVESRISVDLIDRDALVDALDLMPS